MLKFYQGGDEKLRAHLYRTGVMLVPATAATTITNLKFDAISAAEPVL
jgi:hypothetical protein